MGDDPMDRNAFEPRDKWEILVEALASPGGPADVCSRRGVSLGELRAWLKVARRAALDAFATPESEPLSRRPLPPNAARRPRRGLQGRYPLRKPFARPAAAPGENADTARDDEDQGPGRPQPTSPPDTGEQELHPEPSTAWSTEEIDAVFSRTSHELREPLRGMRAIAGFLLDDYGDRLPEKAHTYLRSLNSIAERMRQQLLGLSEYARCTRSITQLRPCALADVLRQVRTSLRPFVTEQNGTVVIDSRLPVVLGDPTALVRAFEHLIRNSVTYCNDPSPKVQVVAAGTEESERMVTIEVRDNGFGIDARYHESVFGLFFRLHRYEAYPGAGVGLAVVQRIIQAHQGRITIASSTNSGTCFSVALLRALEP